MAQTKMVIKAMIKAMGRPVKLVLTCAKRSKKVFSLN